MDPTTTPDPEAPRGWWRDAWPLLAVLLVVVAGFATIALGGDDASDEDAPRVVARVGEREVTEDELEHWYRVLAASSEATAGSIPDPPRHEACIDAIRAAAGADGPVADEVEARRTCDEAGDTLREDALVFLVFAAWIEQEAAERGITADAETVATRFDEIRGGFETTEAWVEFLEQNQLSVEDVLQRIRVSRLEELLIEQAGGDGASEPTEAEIAEYYDEHRLSLAVPERRDIELVVTDDAATARRALAALRGGEAIASVARRYSTDAASKKTGGVVRDITRNPERDATLDAAIFEAAKGELIGPIETEAGTVVARVVDITPARDRSLVESVDDIRALLRTERSTADAKAFSESFIESWRARTTCLGDVRISQCANGPDPAKD